MQTLNANFHFEAIGQTQFMCSHIIQQYATVGKTNKRIVDGLMDLQVDLIFSSTR
jgi:hypothetical protein